MSTDTTAMQDLIIICNTNISHDEDTCNGMYEKGLIRAFQYVKEMAETKLLSREKEQICKSWEDGYYSNGENLQNENEKYYNDTYVPIKI